MAKDRIQQALEDLRSELAYVDFAIQNLEAMAEARQGEAEKPEPAAGSKPRASSKETRPKAKAAGAGG